MPTKGGLTLRAAVSGIGFPFGKRAEPDGGNPSVMVTTGAISGLRRDKSQRLVAIDHTALIWKGNSGGALLDSEGKLICINTWHLGQFGRAIPIAGVHELLGAASLSIDLDPVLADVGGKIRVEVTGKAPAGRLRKVEVRISGSDRIHRCTKHKSAFQARFKVTVTESNAPRHIKVTAVDVTGRRFHRAVWLPELANAPLPHYVRFQSVELGKLKSNGWPWDSPWEGPDIFARIFVNDALLQKTPVVQSQHVCFPAIGFRVKQGDKVRIVVYDNDVKNNDYAGTIRFTAGEQKVVDEADEPEIAACRITVNRIPPR